MDLFAKEARFFRCRVFFWACFLQNLTKVDQYLSVWQVCFKKISTWEHFGHELPRPMYKQFISESVIGDGGNRVSLFKRLVFIGNVFFTLRTSLHQHLYEWLFKLSHVTRQSRNGLNAKNKETVRVLIQEVENQWSILAGKMRQKKDNKPTVQCWGITNRSLQHLIGLSFGDWTRSSNFLVVMSQTRMTSLMLSFRSLSLLHFCAIIFLTMPLSFKVF